MDFVRELCSSIHAARKALGIPTVQPLQTVVLYKSDELNHFLLYPYSKIIADECNIKEVTWEIIFDGDYESFGIQTEAKLDFKTAGKMFGKDTQAVGKMVREGDYKVLNDSIVLGDAEREIPASLVEFKRTVDNESNLKRNYYVTPVMSSSFFVLDTLIYPLLYLEKLAQDVVKLINKERRDRGFQVGDSVDVLMGVPDEYSLALHYHMEMVRKNAKCWIMTFPADTLEISTIKQTTKEKNDKP